MKLRALIMGLVLAGLTWTSGAQAQSARVLSSESGPSAGGEYEYIIGLITRFGDNLSTRDTATELNDTPSLLTNSSGNGDSWAVSANIQYSDSNTSSRLIRSDERLSFLNWIIKDNFNKDKWNVFDNKEYVDAGVPEFGFLKGFTGALNQAILQTGDSDSTRGLTVNETTENDAGQFQF